MKKYVKLAACGLAAAMLVAGCGKKAEETETTAATEAQQEVTDRGEITKLGEYKGVEVTKASTEVTDEELESRINSILEANPEYIEITDRPAQIGDVVNIDYVGMKDGVAFDGGTAQGYDLELGSGTFIDGFEDGLVGAGTGAELSLNLTFPENYGNTELAGQDVVFDVTVNSIKEVKDAQLDAAFVQRVSDFTTVDEWKADVQADMETEKENQADMQLEYEAFNAAVDNSEFRLNDAAVEELYNNQMDYYNSMMQMYGMTLADYVSVLGMTEEEFNEELREVSELTLKQQLLVEAIAEKEGLTVEDADRENVAAQYGMTLDNMISASGAEAVDEAAMMYKVIELIRENAVVK